MLLAEQTVSLPDGRTLSLGTIHDAAAVCRLATNSYRIYERRGTLPGPVQVPSLMHPDRLTALRDDDGEAQYDLNEVRDRNLARPGSGNRTRMTVDSIRRTERRAAMLRDARAGRLLVAEDDPDDVDLAALRDTRSGGGNDRRGTSRAGKDDRYETRRTFRFLRAAGAFTEPDAGRRMRLSRDGQRLLQRFEPADP